MKCNNCGSELREGDKFCPLCGQAQSEQTQNSSQAQSGEAAFAEQAVAQNDTKPNHLKKKKSTGFKVGIAVLIVAVLGVGAVAGAKVVKSVKKMMMSPAEYYQYVETENRDNGEDMMFGYYDTIQKSFASDSNAKKTNMKVEISDTAKSLLSLTGIDFSGFQNLEFDMSTGREKETYSNLIKLRGNDNDLLSIKMYLDSKNKEAYYQIPEINEAYLDISSAMKTQEEEGFIGGMMFPQYDKLFADTKDVKKIYERYTDILIKSAQNVKKSEGGCEAEGISQKADKYTITMNGKEIAKLVKELLETLQKDKEIQNILKNFDEELYSGFQEEIKDALAGVDSELEEDELKAVLEAQVSSDDRIIGRKLTIEADGKKVFGLHYACPKDGKKFGYSLSVSGEDETEIVKMNGSGTIDAGVVNGKLTFGMDNSILEEDSVSSALSLEKLLTIEFKDYDFSKLNKGEAKGTVTYSTEAIAALANYSLKVEVEGNMEKSSGKLSVMAGKDTLVTITVKAESIDKVENVKPSDSDTVYDVENEEDMEKYGSAVDAEQLLEDIQTKLSIDLSNLINMGLLGASGLTTAPEDFSINEDDTDNYLEDDSFNSDIFE